MALLAPKDVQSAILAFIKAKHPELQTHRSVAEALPWLHVNAHSGSNTLHLVAMNMDRMATDRALKIDPATRYGEKHYGLPE
jgi:hypothetical protein